MKCPACGYFDSKVIDSRPSSDGSSIRRRRECLECQKRFTTFETVEETQIVVIKKNGVPVHSSWQTPCQWSETWMEPTGFEFLFFLPAGVDPQPVKAFLTDPKRFETSQTTKR